MEYSLNSLSAHIVQFSRLLRERGVQSGVSEERDALDALERVSVGDRASVRAVLRCVFAKSRDEQAIVDATFDAYFTADSREHHRPTAAPEQDETTEQSQASSPRKPAPSGVQTLMQWLNDNDTNDENKSDDHEEIPSYSPIEVLARKEFSYINADEVQAARTMIAALARSMTLATSRRSSPTNKRTIADIRRTVRVSLRRGGDVAKLLHKRRKIERLRIVMLCDVSKSMDVYSTFLIQFMLGFQALQRQIVPCLETFCFATALHHITPALKGSNVDAALQHLAATIPDWSGGTRIGACLEEFVRTFAPNFLTRKTIVLILSDGWDTGDLDVLERAMANIHQQSGCVLWLNPLAGSAGYEPTAQGMAAALPFVDIFAPAHNIESLRALEKHFVTARRISRKLRKI